MWCISNRLSVDARNAVPHRCLIEGYCFSKKRLSASVASRIDLFVVMSCWLRFTTPIIPSFTQMSFPLRSMEVSGYRSQGFGRWRAVRTRRRWSPGRVWVRAAFATTLAVLTCGEPGE